MAPYSLSIAVCRVGWQRSRSLLAVTPFAARVVAVIYGGGKPGLLAAGLAAAWKNYMFVSPRYEFSFDQNVARMTGCAG